MNSVSRTSSSSALAAPPKPLGTAATATGSTASLNAKRDIFSLIKDAKEREKKSGEGRDDDGVENNFMFVGARGSGKSTLIHRFLDKEDTPSPTVALEYTFGRRTRGINNVKDVVHIWELAGGTFLSDLMAIPFNEGTFHSFTMGIILDLSRPHTLLPTLLHFLAAISARLTSVLESLETRGSKRPKAVRAHHLKKYGAEHPDKDALNLLPINVVIVGTKYDLFKEMEPEKRKLLTRTLRHLAHTHGCSLIYTSTSVAHSDTITKLRSILTTHAFSNKHPQKMCVTDHMKPVMITGGSDSFAMIGVPPSESHSEGDSIVSEGTFSKNVIPLSSWKRDYERYFPATPEDSELNIGGEAQSKTILAELSKYPEAAIDSLRLQKDEEIERLRRANERREKEKVSLKEMGVKKEKTGKSYSRARASGMFV